MDFIKAKEEFKEYLRAYDTENSSVKLKIVHTYHVVEFSEYIAKKQGLDEENIELAKLIALLHDIGRFEQLKELNDFSDTKGIDHADLGVEILFNNGLIRKFIEEDKYDKIIKVAIANHNKYKIEDGLTELELLHSKIIRDADKLDNFRVKEKNDYKSNFPGTENIENICYEKISDKVYKDFLGHKCIKLIDRKTLLDFWVCILAFIYDFNFRSSYKYIKDKNYIDILVDKIEYKNEETKQRMEEIRKCAKEYIDMKIEE